jgi:hypothetical protein
MTENQCSEGGTACLAVGRRNGTWRSDDSEMILHFERNVGQDNVAGGTKETWGSEERGWMMGWGN